jgi:hypothetical protein
MGDTLSFVRVVGKKHVKADLSLDGMRSKECQFVECNLLYSGGPVSMENCMFKTANGTCKGQRPSLFNHSKIAAGR